MIVSRRGFIREHAGELGTHLHCSSKTLVVQKMAMTPFLMIVVFSMREGVVDIEEGEEVAFNTAEQEPVKKVRVMREEGSGESQEIVSKRERDG